MSEKGITVDAEMKLLLVVITYAIIKAVSPNLFVLYFSRVFFIVAHSMFLKYYVAALHEVKINPKLSADAKASLNNKFYLLLRGLCVKAIVVGCLHLRSQILQPLFVSVFLGYFSLLEDSTMYQVMYAQFPSFYDYFFL